VKPETRYARLGEDHIAYQVVGGGDVDLLLTLGSFGHIDEWWDFPPIAHFLNGLSRFSRLILLDRRGFGASDPLPDEALGDWDAWGDEVAAVLDAAGSERVVIMGEAEGAIPAITYAARRPERLAALIIVNASPRILLADDYPIGLARGRMDAIISTLVEAWGSSRIGLMFYPSRADDTRFMEQYARYTRAICGPRRAGDAARINAEWDGRPVLSLIRARTLVIHRREFPIAPFEHGRYLVDHIPGARLLELPGHEAVMAGDDADHVLDEIRAFVTGVRSGSRTGRTLATLAFTDIVGSTRQAAGLGDHRWRSLLDTHDEMSRQYVEQFGGRLLKTTGDGALGMFDSPGRAIHCMQELTAALERRGIDIRVGIHTGEIEIGDGDVGGIGVHIASRIVDIAGAQEIVVSATVRDLVTGSGVAFVDRGSHEFKGVPGEWRLFSVS
jgi:class 3 adenylate cyclase